MSASSSDSRSDFCKNITVPVPPADLSKDYDTVSQTFTAGNPINFYTIVRSAANVDITSDIEPILTAIRTMSPDVVQASILTPLGVNDIDSDENKNKFKQTDFLAKFRQQITTAKTSIQQTYCVYENIYYNALTSYFSDITNKKPADPQKQEIAQQLNKKLTIIIAGINRLDLYMQNKSNNFIENVGWYTQNMNENSVKLQGQLELLQSRSAEADLHKRMSEYTEEKNRANRNLLSLYTLLNAVALGIIFYIAKD